MELKINIQALKYGDRQHYEWETTVLERGEGHIFVMGRPGRQLRHHTKQKVFTVEFYTVEYFSSEHWFTASAEIREGVIEQYYCNINMPALIGEELISFVDLDLDYVYRGGQWMVVDEDEFEAHAVLFSYPEELITRAREELAALQQRIERREFPFDGTLERYVSQIPMPASS